MTSQPKATGGTSAVGGFVFTLALMALLAWIGGVALHHGWGVNVPFIASFLILACAVQVVKLTAHEAGHAWQQQAVGAAGPRAAAEYIGQQTGKAVLEGQQPNPYDGLLEAMSKVARPAKPE